MPVSFLVAAVEQWWQEEIGTLASGPCNRADTEAPANNNMEMGLVCYSKLQSEERADTLESASDVDKNGDLPLAEKESAQENVDGSVQYYFIYINECKRQHTEDWTCTPLNQGAVCAFYCVSQKGLRASSSLAQC